MSDTEPKTKKTKVWQPPSHTMNIVEAVVKENEADGFHALVDAKLTVLQGLGDRGEEMMDALGVHTVRELADWKYGKIAQAIVVLAALEVKGKRPGTCALNIDFAVDKEHEQKSLKEILALPVDAIQGLAPRAAELLKVHHVTTVEKLGKWKYLEWAQAIVTLVDFEETKSPEEKKAERMLNKLS
mmetsp:Transcript_1253/g.2298  ORF Transcript_1253/g.2298 Transcript_1253/m.2298 type:complete len:185 (+) Transcript_1253:224-778(+)